MTAAHSTFPLPCPKCPERGFAFGSLSVPARHGSYQLIPCDCGLSHDVEVTLSDGAWCGRIIETHELGSSAKFFK